MADVIAESLIARIKARRDAIACDGEPTPSHDVLLGFVHINGCGWPRHNPHDDGDLGGMLDVLVRAIYLAERNAMYDPSLLARQLADDTITLALRVARRIAGVRAARS